MRELQLSGIIVLIIVAILGIFLFFKAGRENGGETPDTSKEVSTSAEETVTETETEAETTVSLTTEKEEFPPETEKETTPKETKKPPETTSVKETEAPKETEETTAPEKQTGSKKFTEPPEADLDAIKKASLPEGKAPKGYLDKIAFLGDSTTYGFFAYGFLPRSQVWVPKNGTLAIFLATSWPLYDAIGDCEYPLADMTAKRKPEYMIITLGVNGVSSLSEENFKGYYATVINTVKKQSPNTKIILNSMYPLSENYDTSNGINNTKICIANGWIAELALEYKLPYLDSYHAMIDETGYRPMELQNGDGLHISAMGLQFLIDYFVSHPYR